MYLRKKTRDLDMNDLDGFFQNLLGANDRMDNGAELIYNEWSFFKDIHGHLAGVPIVLTLILFNKMQVMRLEGTIKEYHMIFEDSSTVKLLSLCELLRLVCNENSS